MDSKLGYVAEGRLVKEEDGWYIITDDHVAVKLDIIFHKWEGRRVRMLLANLDILDKVAEMGLLPGREQEFVSGLTDDQLQSLQE